MRSPARPARLVHGRQARSGLSGRGRSAAGRRPCQTVRGGTGGEVVPLTTRAPCRCRRRLQ